MSERPSVPFDALEPGQLLGELAYVLSPEVVDRHRRATEQRPYADPALAPVSILAADGVNLADRHYDISQSVHAGQRLEIARIPRIGERLVVSGVARDKFTKKGRRYVVADTRTCDAGGGLIASGTLTGVIVYAEGSGEGAAAREPRSAEPVPIAKLGPLVRTMMLEAMRLYEEPGSRNLHTHDEVARAAGLPAAIATGTLFLAYVFDLLEQSYGLDALVGSALDVRIRQPVFAGDRLETTADVIARDAARIEHAVRVRGPRGDAIVGTASVAAPRGGA